MFRPAVATRRNAALKNPLALELRLA